MNNIYCSTLYCSDIYTLFNETCSSISKVTIYRLYIYSLNCENFVALVLRESIEGEGLFKVKFKKKIKIKCI